MLSPRPRSPIEQIKHAIKLGEAEARHAREDADAALARAEQAEATALAHEHTAEQWRQILTREEAMHEMQDRINACLARHAAHGGIHKFAEPETTGETFISPRPRWCLCKDGHRCSDCTVRPKGNTNV